MFSVDMLPGGQGDSLWIEYGSPGEPHRILIDGGRPSTYAEGLGSRIEALPEDDRRFELLVVSHIDLDHIGGILELLRNPPAGFEVGDVWFNGFEHLNPGVRGPKQGEGLSARIEEGDFPWNEAFDGGPVSVGEASEPEIRTVRLPGGMAITLLGPTQDRLRRLESEWRTVIEAAGLIPGKAGYILEEMEPTPPVRAPRRAPDLETLANAPPSDDTSRANGSSIAFLAEYEGRRCLFTGDAFSKDMTDAVGALATREGSSTLRLDALKLSHHGGAKNTHPDLIRMLSCDRYLFSTDGSYYDHPDDESVARVIVHRGNDATPRLFFNHLPDEPRFWQRAENLGDYAADFIYPDSGSQGLRVDLVMS